MVSHPDVRVRAGAVSKVPVKKLLEIAQGARGRVTDWFLSAGAKAGVKGYGYGVRWRDDRPTDEAVFEVYVGAAGVTLEQTGAASLFRHVGASSDDLAVSLATVRSDAPPAPRAVAPAAVREIAAVSVGHKVNEPGALQHRQRPFGGGCSIGSPNATAGTLGVRVARHGMRSWTGEGPALVLSNSHVLSDNVLRPTKGTPLTQPGGGDGGVATDAVGELFDAEPLRRPPMVNYMDAAIGVIGDAASLADGLTGLGTPEFWRALAHTPIGTRVAKVGRTSGLTFGYLRSVAVTFRVDYGLGEPLTFSDQMLCSRIARGGDSGSVVFTCGQYPAIVGLLLGGSDDATVVTPIEAIHKRFNVRAAPRQWGVDPPLGAWVEPVRAGGLLLDPNDPEL